MLAHELSTLLENTSGERDSLRFLAEHPEIVRWAFCKTGGHSTYIVKEFPLGSQYKTDFVIAMSYSGMWAVHLIELEPPDDRVINKDGTPSKRFSKAITQLRDWETFIGDNPVLFRRDLADWCVRRDLLGEHNCCDPPCNYTGDYLSHPATFIQLYNHIVIGRRAAVSHEQRRRMNQLFCRGLDSVSTFDRFVDVASNIDRARATPDESVLLTEFAEDY